MSVPPGQDGAAIPPELTEAYEARCLAEGADLGTFVEEVKGRFPAEALLALVDRVEADVLENVTLMARARPDLEEVAERKAAEVRASMDRIRAGLRGG